MAFVRVRFNDVERGLGEEDARFVAEQLRTRRGGLHPVALALAERIEQQAEAPTFAAPERDVELDEMEKVELVEVLDALELAVDQTGSVTAEGATWRAMAGRAGRRQPNALVESARAAVQLRPALRVSAADLASGRED
jgi:hypothetical protein